MRKDALPLMLSTLVLGIFGAFLRWLQLMNIFDEATGLARRGAPISIVYIVYSVVAVAMMLCIVKIWLRRYDRSLDAGNALHCFTAVPSIALWVFAAAFAAAALFTMFAANDTRNPMIQRVFGAAGIIAGCCMPFLLSKRESRTENPMARSAVIYLVLFYCLWLIYSYKVHSEDPVLWSYAPEILAVCASVGAFYYIAAYFYGRAKSDAALFTVQLAAFLNICTIFDERAFWLNVMFGVTAALMLMLEFILIANMRESSEGGL